MTTTYTLEGDTLHMTSPSGTSYDAKIGGPDVAIKGDPAGTTVAVTKAGDNGYRETDKRAGKVVGVATFSVGGDGKLTLLTAGGRTGDLGTGAQPLDIDFGGNGRFLYVLKNGAGTIGSFVVNADGTLSARADTPGLVASAGYMGLAAF